MAEAAGGQGGARRRAAVTGGGGSGVAIRTYVEQVQQHR